VETAINQRNINESEEFLHFIQGLDYENKDCFCQFIQGVKYGMHLSKRKEEAKEVI